MNGPSTRPHRRWSVSHLLAVCVLAIAGLLLLAGRRTGAFGYLPYVLIALCPLMHLFHRHTHGHRDRSSDPPDATGAGRSMEGGIGT